MEIETNEGINRRKKKKEVWEWVSVKINWNLSRDLTKGLIVSIYCMKQIFFPFWL